MENTEIYRLSGENIDAAIEKIEKHLVSCDNMLADDYNCTFYPITKVYLGMNMKNDQRREVIEICKRKEIPYVGVIRSNEKYQMVRLLK